MIYKQPKSQRGCMRQYRMILNACRRDMAGGLTFGMDWPTLRATFPERYARLKELENMYKDLPK